MCYSRAFCMHMSALGVARLPALPAQWHWRDQVRFFFGVVVLDVVREVKGRAKRTGA